MTDTRRQLAQYKRMASDQASMLRWAWLYWLLPLLVLAAGLVLEWHWSVTVIAAIAALAGAIQHMNDSARLHLYRQRVVELEEKAEL